MSKGSTHFPQKCGAGRLQCWPRDFGFVDGITTAMTAYAIGLWLPLNDLTEVCSLRLRCKSNWRTITDPDYAITLLCSIWYYSVEFSEISCGSSDFKIPIARSLNCSIKSPVQAIWLAKPRIANSESALSGRQMQPTATRCTIRTAWMGQGD